jgi:hypothetical protein
MARSWAKTTGRLMVGYAESDIFNIPFTGHPESRAHPFSLAERR